MRARVPLMHFVDWRMPATECVSMWFQCNWRAVKISYRDETAKRAAVGLTRLQRRVTKGQKKQRLSGNSLQVIAKRAYSIHSQLKRSLPFGHPAGGLTPRSASKPRFTPLNSHLRRLGMEPRIAQRPALIQRQAYVVNSRTRRRRVIARSETHQACPAQESTRRYHRQKSQPPMQQAVIP